MQWFNYYIQWQTDTNNLLWFTNLHDLSAFGNHLCCTYGTNKTPGLFLQKRIDLLSESKKSLNTSWSQKKDVSTSSNVSSEALKFHEPLVSLLSPSSLSSLARPSCPTVQRGCFGDCGPKLPSQGSHSKGFWGLEGGIRPHCRMFSKLRKGKQGQEEERKTFAFPNAIQCVD